MLHVLTCNTPGFGDGDCHYSLEITRDLLRMWYGLEIWKGLGNRGDPSEDWLPTEDEAISFLTTVWHENWDARTERWDEIVQWCGLAVILEPVRPSLVPV